MAKATREIKSQSRMTRVNLPEWGVSPNPPHSTRRNRGAHGHSQPLTASRLQMIWQHSIHVLPGGPAQTWVPRLQGAQPSWAPTKESWILTTSWAGDWVSTTAVLDPSLCPSAINKSINFKMARKLPYVWKFKTQFCLPRGSKKQWPQKLGNVQDWEIMRMLAHGWELVSQKEKEKCHMLSHTCGI